MILLESKAHLSDIASEAQLQSDMALLSSDGEMFNINKMLFASVSTLGRTLLPLAEYEDDHMSISVEASSKELIVATEFIQFGLLPIDVSAGVQETFAMLGIAVQELEFSRTEHEENRSVNISAVMVASEKVPSVISDPMIAVDVKLEEWQPQGDTDREEEYDDSALSAVSEEDFPISEDWLGEESPRKKRKIKGESAPAKNSAKRVTKGKSENNTKYGADDEPDSQKLPVLRQCLICLATVSKLWQHLATHNNEKLVCKECNKTISTPRNFQSHMKRAHQSPRVVCEDCGQVTRDNSHLKMHRLVYHTAEEDKPFHCDICPDKRAFVRRWQYDRHMNVHNKVSFQCESCAFIAYHEFELKDHRRARHKPGVQDDDYVPKQLLRTAVDDGQEPKFCKYVPMMQKPHLQPGMRKKPKKDTEKAPKVRLRAKKHPNPRHAICEHCGKEFTGKGAHIRHREHVFNLHTAEEDKPFHCPVCGKGFSCKRALNNHSSVHEDTKRFQCSICSATFRFSGNRNAHERQVHLKLGKSLKGVGRLGVKYNETPEERLERFKKKEEEFRSGGGEKEEDP